MSANEVIQGKQLPDTPENREAVAALVADQDTAAEAPQAEPVAVEPVAKQKPAKAGTRSGRKSTRQKLAGFARNAVTEAWDEGKSIKAIATECGMTEERVTAFLAAARKGFKTPEDAEKPEAKPSRRTRAPKPAAPSLPDGTLKFHLSTSAYKVLVENATLKEHNPKAIKALKASDKERSATKAKNLPYHFPVMTRDDALACSAVLRETVKMWEKLPSKERGGDLTSVKRYSVLLSDLVKPA